MVPAQNLSLEVISSQKFNVTRTDKKNEQAIPMKLVVKSTVLNTGYQIYDFTQMHDFT